MKKIFLLLIFIFTLTNCKFVHYNDINYYRGSVILEISNDTIGIVDSDTYILTVKNSKGLYNIIYIQPEYGKLFNVGDTI